MVHRAAIQLGLALTNVLISYIIGVGGYFFLSFSNATPTVAPLIQSYLGRVMYMEYTERLVHIRGHVVLYAGAYIKTTMTSCQQKQWKKLNFL